MTKELTNGGGFDYRKLNDPELAADLMATAALIGKAKRLAVEQAIIIGERLIHARQRLAKHGHGTFLEWMSGDPQISYSQSSAYRFIGVAERFAEFRSSQLGRIEVSAAYELAKTDSPKLAVKAAVKMADAGKEVTLPVAKELIKKHSTKQPAAPRDERAKDRHATADTENRTEADGGDPIRPDEEDPDSCLDSGLPHKWISDGNGDRYCETCKVDHQDNEQRPDPRETAVKHLNGIAATLVQARINFDHVCQDLGTRPASYDQIMSDADKALVSIRRWAKELLP